MKTGNSILATLGLVFSTAIVGLTPPSAAMNVRESIRVLETVHPDSAVVQTVKVVGRALDVTSTRGGIEFKARANFADLDEDHIVYQGASAKTRQSFAFLTVYCKGKRECVEVTSDGKWNASMLLIETNTLEADKVKNAIRTLIRINE